MAGKRPRHPIQQIRNSPYLHPQKPEPRTLRARHPNAPIIATGGKTNESVTQTIEAGANAITYTPPSTQELFGEIMEKYRD